MKFMYSVQLILRVLTNEFTTSSVCPLRPFGYKPSNSLKEVRDPIFVYFLYYNYLGTSTPVILDLDSTYSYYSHSRYLFYIWNFRQLPWTTSLSFILYLRSTKTGGHDMIGRPRKTTNLVLPSVYNLLYPSRRMLVEDL